MHIKSNCRLKFIRRGEPFFNFCVEYEEERDVKCNNITTISRAGNTFMNDSKMVSKV